MDGVQVDFDPAGGSNMMMSLLGPMYNMYIVWNLLSKSIDQRVDCFESIFLKHVGILVS
jgi:hypothetical protein